MYRIALFFAFLAYCLAVPFGGPNIQQRGSFQQDQVAQQPQINIDQQQQQQQQFPDESDVVDNTGAGYSYFKKQPVVSRPLIQQQLPKSDRDQSSLSSQDDFQWSDYLRASALRQQPARPQQFLQQQPQLLPISNDQLNVENYGQQQILPINNDQLNYGQRQQSIPRSQINTGMSLSLQDRLPQQVQNAYGSIASQQQQQQQQLNTLNNDQSVDTAQVPSSLSTDNDNLQGLQQQQQPQDIPVQSNIGGNLRQQQKPWWSNKQVQNGIGSSYDQIPQQQDQQQQQQQQSFMTRQEVQPSQLSDSDWDDSASQQQPQQSLIRPTVFSIKSQSNWGQQPQLQPQPAFNDQIMGNFGQQQQQALVRPSIPWNTQQQILRPAFVDQQNTLTSDFNSQQQQQQPQLKWSNQQQGGFVSSFRQGQQQPLTSSFLIQSRQENGMKPVATAVFTSNIPVQRSITQPNNFDSDSSFNNGGR